MSVSPSHETSQRQHWMSVLAMAPTETLIERSDQLIAAQEFEDIRTAEVGLAQVRGRMGGTGSAFNLGDMTITRCVLRSAEGHYGYSYVAGRDKSHAQRAAELDALLQSDNHRELILSKIVTPLADLQQQQDQLQREKAESTRVNFFTLIRGED